jgi:hypothetical protein
MSAEDRSDFIDLAPPIGFRNVDVLRSTGQRRTSCQGLDREKSAILI